MTPPHTGTDYVTAITARESDRLARSAFRELVLRLAPPGGALFDFGAGPGLDSKYFAEQGLRVRAYDNDPKMSAFFAHYCHDFVASGRISLETGDYAEFLARPPECADRRVDLVTANFAPLNLVADLGALFARFHALTTPDGKVVASVLSPYYIGDMRYGWWWRNLPRLRRLGQYSLRGAHGQIVRRSPADLAAQCAPTFVLERVFTGLPPGNGRGTAGIAWPARNRGAWLHLSNSRFMFVVFRKSGLGPA
ncbi:MAG TPA: methyltransferase domain-containing protein [Steroidobacteraceae bacterium]|nr:methyltransferase domain-containing protein [Steroidobacteraceae bacterium]